MAPEEGFSPDLFRRFDEGDDAHFYAAPRFVLHIDDATVAALTQVYREWLSPGDDVLDLMSSWVSHLPEELELGRVCGLGMNEAELAANPRLGEHRVQDLNREPELPYADASFDAVLNAVSIQYLTRPVEVLRSVARVLRPGGFHGIAFSHRCFPTKAIQAHQVLAPEGRGQFLARCFAAAGGFDEARFIDRSPPGADPLWIVVARRAG